MDAAAEANSSSPVYDPSDSSVELCDCGSRFNHSWALTSQCGDFGDSSSSWGIERLPPSLVEEIEKYSDTYKAESDSSSISSSWGIERLPPSLVAEIEEYSDTHKAESDSSSSDTVILPKTVTECTECKEKEAEVKRLKRVTQKLKIRIRQLESTLEAEMSNFEYTTTITCVLIMAMTSAITTNLTNRDLLETINSEGKHAAAEYILSLSSQSSSMTASLRACTHIVNNLISKRKNLLKKKGNDVSLFLDQLVCLPKANSNLRKPKNNAGSTCSCPAGNVAVKLASECSIQKEVTENVALQLKETSQELQNLKKSRISKSTVLKISKENKSTTHYCKTLRSKLERKTKSIKAIQQRNNRLNKQLCKKNVTIERLTHEVRRLESIIENQNCEIENLSQMKNTNAQLLNDSMAENEWLREIVENDRETIQCYDEVEKKYTCEVRECIYQLLSLSVSSRNVSPVIETVLSMVKKVPNKLPARSTILDMNIERLLISQTQLSQDASGKKNTTLYTDETTKFGTKYTGYHLSDQEGRMYVLGLRELETKSASDTLATFQEILKDIEDRYKVDDSTVSKKILVNIVATMSDRASTEIKFNELVQDFRRQILPDLIENWSSMSNEDQTAVSQLMNFFCGLHSLVHFAEAASKALIQTENASFDQKAPILDKSFLKSSESGTLRLVRTASKALARGADEKCGKYMEFKLYLSEFLKEHGFYSLPLQPFRGNRFNILFENAASVFFLSEHMTEFLTGLHTNTLLKSVLFDLKVPLFVAGTKALGLVSRLITVPLWCLIEDKQIHILEMNLIYSKLLDFLEYSTENLSDFMKGKAHSFNESAPVKKDAIYKKLIEDWKHDDLVQIHLAVILPALTKLAKHIFKDQLPGGNWSNVTQPMMDKTIGMHKHNKFAESVFGYLDMLLRRSPNISSLASEAYIMFTANKTGEWLKSKTEIERKEMIAAAQKDMANFKCTFQKRKAEIARKRKQALADAFAKTKKQEENRIQKLENYTSDIVYYQLWQSVDQVDLKLSDIPLITEKKKALKCQLNFRQHVLKQKPDNPKVFLFSKSVDNKNKQLSVEELTENLKVLVQHSFTLPKLTLDKEVDPILVGKSVKHKFTSEGTTEWYTGRVISQVPGFAQWYNIFYESDAETVYTYKLLDDWKNKDLEVIV